MLVVVDTKQLCGCCCRVTTNRDPRGNIAVFTTQDGGRDKGEAGVSRGEGMAVALVWSPFADGALEDF